MTNPIESYLEKAWGDSVDNVTIDHVRQAILETQKMDDEHGAFWVSLFINEENVLETHKDLEVIGIFETEPEKQYKAKFDNWTEIENLYKIFLSVDFEKVKTILTQRK